jgi:hypothetical protein
MAPCRFQRATAELKSLLRLKGAALKQMNSILRRSNMPSGIIQLASNPSFCMAASDQQNGSKLQLMPVSGTNTRLILWNWSRFSQQITLISTMNSPEPLVVDTQDCSSETDIIVANRDTSSESQQWQWLGATTFLISVGCPGMVIDNDHRQLNPGNPIWLYQNNGSPAQQWILERLDPAEVTAALA